MMNVLKINIQLEVLEQTMIGMYTHMITMLALVPHELKHTYTSLQSTSNSLGHLVTL